MENEYIIEVEGDVNSPDIEYFKLVFEKCIELGLEYEDAVETALDARDEFLSRED